MKQPTGYPVIDGILESIAPRVTTSNSAQARAELDDQLFNYCYQSICYSNLWPYLENDGWDALAERLRAQVRTFVEGEIDAELTRIEAERGFGY